MYNLKNNFKFFIKNIRCNKTFCISLFIKVGSCIENQDEKGISHFLEHMLFKGTNKYKNLSHILDINGFTYNAMTMKECTLFYIKSANPNKINLIIDILYEIAFNVKFNETSFNKEKTVIFDEIQEDQSDLNTILYNLSENELFDQKYYDYNIYNYNRNISGSIKDVSKLNLNKIKEFYKKYYIINNMFLVFYGNFPNENIIHDSLSNTFFTKKTNIKLPNFLLNNSVNSIDTNRNTIICKGITENTKMGTVMLNFPIPGYNENSINFDLYSFILTKGVSSELFELLRIKNGIVYSIESNCIYYKSIGMFNISFNTNNDNIGKSIKLILNFLKKDINVKQLDKSKIMYLEEINQNDDIIYKSEKIGFNILYDCNIKSTNTIDKELNNININHINSLKKKYLINKKLVVTHISNKSDKYIKNIILKL